jgi:hypothetical protein
VLAQTLLAPGQYAFAPLPGGLRRPAKTHTTAFVYRRAVGDGSASNSLRDAVPIPGATRASAFGLAVNEQSGVSRPAREPLDVHDEPMCWLKRFWHRGNTLSHRCRAAYAAPLKHLPPPSFTAEP